MHPIKTPNPILQKTITTNTKTQKPIHKNLTPPGQRPQKTL